MPRFLSSGTKDTKLLLEIFLLCFTNQSFDIQIAPGSSPPTKSDIDRDGTRDSGGVTYSLDIGGDRTPVFCDHPVLYYYLE